MSGVSTRDVLAEARRRVAVGETKASVFASLSPGYPKPKLLANQIANIPDPRKANDMVWSTRILSVLAGLQGLLVLFNGIFTAMFAAGPFWWLPIAALVFGFVFFVAYMSVAMEMWRRRSGSAFTAYVMLLILGIWASIRFSLDFDAGLLIAAAIQIVILVYTIHVRNTLFGRRGFFGGLRKSPDGSVLFD